MKNLIVLAGGPSVLKFPYETLHQYAPVIGVNDACLRVKCEYGLTMDRLWWENRHTELLASYLVHGDKKFYMREGINKKGLDDSFVTYFRCPKRSAELSPEHGVLQGMNSGICAINLAWQIQPQQLFLFGFDMKRGERPYWYDPYPWAPQGATTQGKYNEWRKDMELVAYQLRQYGIMTYTVGDTAMKEFINLDWPNFKVFCR